MAISEVKEVEEKEESESIITSAKGIYAAVILKGRTHAENKEISDVDVKDSSNIALMADSSIEGSYYVWYWCPSVDGTYKTSGRSYERVNVPRYDERGEEIVYYVGDIIDISFDGGQLGAPRFVRYWGLVNTSEGTEVVKSNIVGIKSGDFPSVLPDALNLYKNQEGTPAFNLYPYLYKILTGSEDIDDPGNKYYTKNGTDSEFCESLGSGSTQSGDVINSRFTYSFLPFSSYWTYVWVSRGGESNLKGWKPFEHEIVSGPFRTDASPWSHLQPYWVFSNTDNDITNIQNLIKYLTAIKYQGADRAKSQVTEIYTFYTEPLNKAYWDAVPEEYKEKNDKGYIPYEEFSRGPNSRVTVKTNKGGWWEFWKAETEQYTMYTEPILKAISSTDKEKVPLVKEAIRSYLTSVLNIALSKFTDVRADCYFDALVYVSLYQYVRHFYNFSVVITTSSIETDPPNTGDIRSMLSGINANRKTYNKILAWAKTLFSNKDLLKEDPEGIREHALNEISSWSPVDEDVWASTTENEITDKTIKILNNLQMIYKLITTIDEKYPLIEGWLKLFEDDEKIKNAIKRLQFIRDMIKNVGESEFVEKVNENTLINNGSIGSVGELAWPVPYASVSKTSISCGFTGSKIVPDDPSIHPSGHKGVDISVGGIFGKPIIAVTSGTVFKAVDGYEDVRNDSAGYGNHVIIIGDNVATLYGHCQKGSVSVKTGDRVTAKTVIANVGTSGYSTGPHLHFEVRPGTGNSYYNRTAVDPLEYYFGTKVSTSSSGTGSLSGNAKLCAEALKKLGLNNAAVAGVMGNIERESGFNPAALGTYAGNNYYGLFQCGPYISPDFLKKVPDWKTNISGQINYIWDYIGEGLRNTLKNVSNDEAGVKVATERFLHSFEKPCQDDGHPQWPVYYECTEFKNQRFPKAKVHFENLNK